MDLNARLQAVKLWICDVDGVLTDGRIVLDDSGRESKFFDVRDGHGLVLLRRAGLRTGLLTGRTSQVVAHRASELGIDFVVQGSNDKLADFEQMAARAGVGANEVGYMGDDLVDLPVLTRVGFSAAPADAHPEVCARVHYVAKNAGGRGAVREAAELLLQAQGAWQAIMGGLLA